METSKRSKLLPTTGGITANGGNFQGFMNVHTAGQTIGFSGPFVFNSSGSNTTGVNVFVNAGQIVPVNCTYVRGFSGSVLAFLP